MRLDPQTVAVTLSVLGFVALLRSAGYVWRRLQVLRRLLRLVRNG